MKKLIFAFIITAILFMSCIPGMLLEFENLSREPIRINYTISDSFLFDDLSDGFIPTVNSILQPGEKCKIYFSWPKLYNHVKSSKDYFDISTYKILFESFSIILLNENRKIEIDDSKYFSVKYRKEGVSSHIYTIFFKRDTEENG